LLHQLLERKETHYSVLVTLFKRANNLVIASFSQPQREALKICGKIPSGGHANASGAIMPKSTETSRTPWISPSNIAAKANGNVPSTTWKVFFAALKPNQ